MVIALAAKVQRSVVQPEVARVGRFLVWLLALNSMAASVPLPNSVETAGCYRFDRPLGHSASGDLERSDSTWYLMELRENGSVIRPRLEARYWRDQYARNSSWRVVGDTLRILVTTGLVGWDLTLISASGEYVGAAQYLTDAIDPGAEPLFVTVRGVRGPCQ
jgi:hypothetical protein